jgi:hypothetical protein
MKTYYLRVFYEFLKSKGLVEDYKKNRRDELIYSQNVMGKVNITLYIGQPNYWIILGFNWERTDEVKEQKWDLINKEWELLVRLKYEEYKRAM